MWLGDISKEIRQRTSQHGQAPYAIIVTCSDSRVIPENIFSAGIGELFVIRLAGKSSMITSLEALNTPPDISAAA